jgi:hypothetical protein
MSIKQEDKSNNGLVTALLTFEMSFDESSEVIEPIITPALRLVHLKVVSVVHCCNLSW